MPEPNVFPLFVRVSSPTREPLPAERRAFYSWIAPKLIDRAPRVEQPAHSVYLTAEEMKADPGSIWNVLAAPPSTGGRPSLVIIDLATNPYHLLRDIFLMHVAEISTRWLRASPSRKIAILLPLRPPPASLFWLPFAAEDLRPEHGRLLTISNDGAGMPGGRAMERDYADHQLPSKQTLTEQLESRIIRKVGHYEFSVDGEAYCARYFFETERAEREIGDLVIQWVREHARPGVSDAAITLVSSGRQADRFHDAVSGAAAALDCEFVPLREEELTDDLDISGVAALVFDVVDTERTVKRTVDELRARHVTVSDEVLAVLKVDSPPSASPPVAIRALCGPYHRQKVPRSQCPQCRVKLDHTPAKAEAQTSIRAYDMWHTFVRSAWVREGFGPRGQPRYGWIPDLGDIFAGAYGPWIAYKVGMVLRTLALDQEVVFVCPEEPHIGELLVRLGVLLQNRQVTVQVPRAILNRRDPDVRGRQIDGWYRQLSHLGQRGYQNLVILDEFTASHTTARSLIRLLRAKFDLDPALYIPIIDFAPSNPVEGVRTVPLYRLPHPRGNP